jgi:hypothetical protein
MIGAVLSLTAFAGAATGAIGAIARCVRGDQDEDKQYEQSKRIIIGTIAGAAFAMLGAAIILANTPGACLGAFVGIMVTLIKFDAIESFPEDKENFSNNTHGNKINYVLFRVLTILIVTSCTGHILNVSISRFA